MLSKILNNKFVLIGIVAVIVVLIIVILQFVNLKKITNTSKEINKNAAIPKEKLKYILKTCHKIKAIQYHSTEKSVVNIFYI